MRTIFDMGGKRPWPAAWARLAREEAQEERNEAILPVVRAQYGFWDVKKRQWIHDKDGADQMEAKYRLLTPDDGYVFLLAELFKSSLKRRKLMFYHATTRAADRGTAVHKVFEDWTEYGTIPNLADFPEEQRGFVRGLAAWIMEAQPEVLSAEEVVGSVKHGYAGRLDMTLLTRVNGKRRLSDIKTSKSCYPRSHFPQLEAYEHARIEMGEEPVEEKSIIVIGAAGDFREVLSRDATFEDFRVLLAAHRSQDAIPVCSVCWRTRCNCRRSKRA